MKRQIKLWGSRTLVLVFLVTAGQYWGAPLYKQYFVKKKVDAFVPTAKVQAGKFVVSFHEIGTLEAEKSVPVNAEVGGKIITLIGDGKEVSAGALIAEFDTTEMQREVRAKELAHQNALADVGRAKSELAILQESNRTEVEQAEAQLNYDKNELERAKKELQKQKDLADQKLVPRYKVDDAGLAVTSKEFAVQKGEKDLALKKKEVQSKEEQKQADVRNVEFKEHMAALELEEAQRQVKKSSLVAPASGLVVISKDWTPDGRRKLKEGDSVRPRQTICELPDLTSMLVKVQVGESDAPKVRVGLPTMIRLEAVPNKVFHGTVSDVASLAVEPSPWDTNATPGRKNFEVTIRVREVDPKSLKPGMTADVEFITDTMDKATYTPLEAVNERSGTTFVYVKDGKRYIRRNVKTGKNNDNFICIKSGLREGEVVALRDPNRPLEQQEAGTAEQNREQDKKPKPAPVPGSD